MELDAIAAAFVGGAAVAGGAAGVVVEATGVPAVGAQMAYSAIKNGKHVVMVNVEADVTEHRSLRHGSSGQVEEAGSGAIILRRGKHYVLTNRHVIYHELDEPMRLTFEIQLENGIQLPAMLDFYSRTHDLAVVIAPGIGGWGLPAPLRMCSDLAVGEQIFAVGSPIVPHVT